MKRKNAAHTQTNRWENEAMDNSMSAPIYTHASSLLSKKSRCRGVEYLPKITQHNARRHSINSRMCALLTFASHQSGCFTRVHETDRFVTLHFHILHWLIAFRLPFTLAFLCCLLLVILVYTYFPLGTAEASMIGINPGFSHRHESVRRFGWQIFTHVEWISLWTVL